jgi:hypothetical protein
MAPVVEEGTGGQSTPGTADAKRIKARETLVAATDDYLFRATAPVMVDDVVTPPAATLWNTS